MTLQYLVLQITVEPELTTTSEERPPFCAHIWELLLHKWPLNNDHLSTTATIFGSRGWLLYTGLTVFPNVWTSMKKKCLYPNTTTTIGQSFVEYRSEDITLSSSPNLHNNVFFTSINVNLRWRDKAFVMYQKMREEILVRGRGDMRREKSLENLFNNFPLPSRL